MAFEPRSGEHALVEVVFGFSLTSPVDAHHIEALSNNHERWREVLPGKEPMGGMPIMFGSPSQLQFSFGGGIAFNQFLPDGNVAWRLSVEGNNIFVNCLKYTGWDEVWPKVRFLFEQISEAALGELIVQSCVFQTIDGFDWFADGNPYDARKLFRADCRYISQATLDVGPQWHSHQGWFERKAVPKGASQVLQRVHLDANGNEEKADVRCDIYQGAFLIDPTPLAALTQKGGEVDIFFDFLHDSNKSLLRSYITEETAERIGLNGANV